MSRPLFTCFGEVVDVTTHRNKLLQVGKKLGIENTNQHTMTGLCDAIYQTAMSTGKFYNPSVVQGMHGESFSRVSTEAEAEMQAVDEEDDDDVRRRRFLFPESTLARGSILDPDEGLTEKQKLEMGNWIKTTQDALFRSPDLQIAGERDEIKGIQYPNQSREDQLWGNCDDDEIEHEESMMKRHQRPVHTHHVSRFYHEYSSGKKFARLIQACANALPQDVIQVRSLLSSMGEPLNLNDKVDSDLAKTLGRPGLAGKTALMTVIVSPNLLQVNSDPWSIAKEIIGAHITHATEEVDPNDVDSEGNTAILLLLKRCRLLKKEIDALRASGVEELADVSGDTMVEHAYTMLHDLLLLLLKPKLFFAEDEDFEAQPINVNKANKGLTAFHVATRSNCLRCLRMLQRHASDIDASIQDEATGRTALHDAVRLDHPKLVYRVLEERVSRALRARDRDYSTVFHIAARHGWNTGYLRHTEDKQKVLDLWKQSHEDDRQEAPQIVEMLYEQLQASIEGGLHEGKRKKEELIKEAYQHTLEEKVPTPLYTRDAYRVQVREQKKRLKISQLVLDAENSQKLTALMIAALKRDPRMVAYLLRKNADPTIQHAYLHLTAAEMVEYDLVPEVDSLKIKDRAEVIALLRAATEAAKKKAKAARLGSYEPLLNPEDLETKKSPITWSNEATKELARTPLLKQHERELVNFYNALYNVVHNKGGVQQRDAETLREIKKKWVDRFLRPEFSYALEALPMERDQVLSERYRLAEFFHIREVNQTLSELEDKIKESSSGLRQKSDPLFRLYQFIENYLLPHLYQRK